MEKNKTFTLVIKHSDDRLEYYSNNEGFSYYELMGILHDYITNDVISKSDKVDTRTKKLN